MQGGLFGGTAEFAQYPVDTVFHGRPAKPRFRPGSYTWPDADLRFRDSVKFYLAKGANFAGSFTKAKTTCGTGCSYIVVVDSHTGQIFKNLPFRMVVVGGARAFDGLSYHLDSRLLIMEGYVYRSEIPTRSYYVWEEKDFRLIQKTPLTPR